ncbi:histidine-rich glycoprotein-like [Rhinatrema bivittatum]|uniref:histidine-rich glycoprotein-like n=1 Tax=Rhinatrema bivittatum TaxID=194408 RepID=UPI001127D042|nr:histidine-rich glycoprotein-like [Rhinatrema bivittatum]
MKPFMSLLFLIILSSSSSLSPKSILPADCNATFSPAVKALDWINKVQEDEYILSLFRISDAHEQPVTNGTIYYLTMDVIETKCPVMTKKHWLDCQIKPFLEMMYGQCKAVIYINNEWSIVQLHSYNCTISPVPSLTSTIVKDVDNNPFYREKAEEALKIYNGENNFTNYFKVKKVGRVSKEWFSGPLYFVEFTIRETNCSKSIPDVNVSKCHFLENEPAIGYCRSKIFVHGPNSESATVSCEVYDLEEEHSEDPDVDPKDCPGDGHRHRHGHGHGHGHKHKHRHGHTHKHGHSHRKGHKHHHHPHSNAHSEHHHEHEHGHSHRKGHRHHHHPHSNGHNNTHPEHQRECRPPHRGLPPGHWQRHHHHNGHNKTMHKRPVSHGSSSEEHFPNKVPCFPQKPFGAVQYAFWENGTRVFPVPIIPDQPELLNPLNTSSGLIELPGPGEAGARLPPCKVPPVQSFPVTHSDSESCPGQPREHMPDVLHLFSVNTDALSGTH